MKPDDFEMQEADPKEWNFHKWNGGLTEAQVALQEDLCSLVDGELDEAAAARVMVQLEESPACREFFEDIRRYARLHKDMSDPDRLMARVAMFGVELANEAEEIDLSHRLATIFFQLGKAYTLAAIEPELFIERVFEAAVPVEQTRSHGRGFIDGAMMGGHGKGVDWRGARQMLNGRLERIEHPLEKGRRLLAQAVETDSHHEEAKIYLAYLYNHQGKRLKAADLYREVFETGVSMENRGHAAVQLGRLYRREDEPRKALMYWRWVIMSGLADSDARFWFVRFNIGSIYTTLRNQDRALDYFRSLLDIHPERAADVAQLFANFEDTRAEIEAQEGFGEALMARCPEIFQIQEGCESPPGAEPPGGESS